MFPFFANSLLLWGTAAASIPIIIHLLNRQRFKRVMWAAMHWLWASYKKSRRRDRHAQGHRGGVQGAQRGQGGHAEQGNYHHYRPDARGLGAQQPAAQAGRRG